MTREEQDILVKKLAELDDEMYEIEDEHRAIQQLHRMFQLVLALLEAHQSIPPVDTLTGKSLMFGYQDFYNSYVTTWERKWSRASKVWWSLTEAILHTVGDDFETLFGLWMSLRWISFSETKRDFSETDPLIRLMLDEKLGPDLLECYYEDEDDPNHRLDDLREATSHYLQQTVGPHQRQRIEAFIQEKRAELEQ